MRSIKDIKTILLNTIEECNTMLNDINNGELDYSKFKPLGDLMSDNIDKKINNKEVEEDDLEEDYDDDNTAKEAHQNFMSLFYDTKKFQLELLKSKYLTSEITLFEYIDLTNNIIEGIV